MFPLKDNIATSRFPLLTVLFILINVLVYFSFQDGGLRGVDQTKVIEYGAIPYEISNPGDHCGSVTGPDGQISGLACEGETGVTGTAPDQLSTLLTLLTSMFMHGGLFHLIGNMLFLWIFGNNVEDSMGRPKFVLFYLLGGLAALAGQVAVDPDAAVPTIGASGAVAAVLGGYILLHPRARVLTLVVIVFFFTFVELPALVMLGLWFAQQVVFGWYDLVTPVGDQGGVAYFAHIGGFLFGLAAIKLFARRQRRPGLQPSL